MKDGDIYFWRYADGANIGPSPYHCKSCKAVVVGGRLIDTFWSSPSDGSVIDPSRVVLDFKGNKADLRIVRTWELPYYDEADIVDMRHANSSREECYVKSTSLRSRDAMLVHIANMRREQEGAIRSAQYKLDLLRQSEDDVMAGRLDAISV